MSASQKAIVVVLCGTLIACITFGVRTSFGLFLGPMSSELGWGREVFAFAIAVQNLLWGAAQPFTGALADKYGTRPVVLACAALFAAGVWLMAHADTPGTMLLTNGVMVGLALSGTSFAVVFGAIGRMVVPEKRSLYLGIASAGASSGQIVLVPLGQTLLSDFGWSAALSLLGIGSAVALGLALALPGRDIKTAQPEGKQSLSEALVEAKAHGGYRLLVAGFFVCGFHVAFVGTHLPAYLVDRGIAPEMGATALALIGAMNVLGSFFAGHFGGRYSKKYLLAGLYLLRGAAFTLFLVLPISNLTVILFAVAMGFAWLSTVPLTSGLVAQIFGPRYMATLFGIVFFSHQLGSFVGVWLGGLLYDRFGSYDAVWWAAVGLAVLAALLHWPIDERAVTRPATA
ncbi:MAG: MFS transporter [Alphaproteobacteria bacterium]|nr:MFS transporter [Alphaproteobacteria bacterium]